MQINGYKLVQTCAMCPEQYNVFKKNQQVGYLRLRHGYFTVSCPDVNGTEVHFDMSCGYNSFMDDERDFHLTNAVKAIDRYLRNV
jgi:hypothetical protein